MDLTARMILLVLYFSRAQSDALNSCKSPSVVRGRIGLITCYFSQDLEKSDKDIIVSHYFAGDQRQEVLQCYGPRPRDCKTQNGYSLLSELKGKNLTLGITSVADHHAGSYLCQMAPSNPDDLVSCNLLIEAGPSPQPTSPSITPSTLMPKGNRDDNDENSTVPVAAIVIPVAAVILVFVIVAGLLCRKRIRFPGCVDSSWFRKCEADECNRGRRGDKDAQGHGKEAHRLMKPVNGHSYKEGLADLDVAQKTTSEMTTDEVGCTTNNRSQQRHQRNSIYLADERCTPGKSSDQTEPLCSNISNLRKASDVASGPLGDKETILGNNRDETLSTTLCNGQHSHLEGAEPVKKPGDIKWKTNGTNLQDAKQQTGNKPALLDETASAVMESMSEVSAAASPKIPPTPDTGVVIKVTYAGSCFPEMLAEEWKFSYQNECSLSDARKEDHIEYPRIPGVEIAGKVYEVGSSVANNDLTPGDKVVIFRNNSSDAGYTEYIPVDKVERVIRIPDSLQPKVAAMLPGAALTAYSALMSAKSHIEAHHPNESCIKILVVGAGRLGLWTIQMARFLLGSDSQNVELFAADSSTDKLQTAGEDGYNGVVHWNEEEDEQEIIERTQNECQGDVDVIVDYVSTKRTIQRSMKILKKEGLILVGGNLLAAYEVNISLRTLIEKQQKIGGFSEGTLSQLQEVLSLVAEKKVIPPRYTVRPSNDAVEVFKDLRNCSITEPVVFRFAD